MNLIEISPANHRTYGSRANLEAALVKLNIHNHRHMICRTPTDSARWTAVFVGASCINGQGGMPHDGLSAVLGTGFLVVS